MTRLTVPADAHGLAFSASRATARVSTACTGFITPEALALSLGDVARARADLAQLHRNLMALRPRRGRQLKEQTQ
ncbi:MAG: hypothetical protein GC145_18735 [Caulobacter sp.]|nr:hypothetical protein [Caulobacter sp.]